MKLADRLREALQRERGLPLLEGDSVEQEGGTLIPAAVLIGITDRAIRAYEAGQGAEDLVLARSGTRKARA